MFKAFVESWAPRPLLDLYRRVRFLRFSRGGRIHYSQEGEDIILRRLFEGLENGFYIDVGAHHPFRYSNTCLFYKLGWHGINIDPLPSSLDLFNRFRPRDINIMHGVSTKEELMTYYIFNDAAFNTLSDSRAQELIRQENDINLITTTRVRTLRLDRILNDNIDTGRTINFMNIDAEGLDLDVLQSNDWETFRPTFLLVEIHSSSFKDVSRSKINLYLEAVGYEPFCKTVNTVFFRDMSNPSA